jgi:hypothetical protein
MRATHLLCAMALCAPLALEVGAAELPARDATAPGDTGRSAGTIPNPDRSTRAGRSPSNQTDAAKNIAPNRHSSPAVTPSRGSIAAAGGTAHLDRNNADRVRSPLPRRSPGTMAKAGSGAVASKRAVAAPADGGIRRSGGGSLDSRPILPTRPSPLKAAVRSATSHAAPPRGSGIGGASALNSGRVGGSVTARAANHGMIDGTQVHRRF